MMVVHGSGTVRRDPGSVVTVGTFDGVHLGHREVITAVVTRARELAARSVVMTFDPHPKEVVASARGPVELLSTMGERAAAFERLGVDLLLVIPFTYEFSRLSSREFYERHVSGEVGVREVIVGHDHTFGRDREGNIEPLRAIGNELGFAVRVLPPFLVDGERISSTRIRTALREGNAAKAARFLGSPYTLSGTVVPGDGRGRGLGYPTANIAVQAARKVIPADGVYVVQAELSGESHRGMMNIGVRPTVTDGHTRTLEVHLLGSHGDLAGESITVGFLDRLRDERKFASLDELIGQLARDRAAAESFGHER